MRFAVTLLFAAACAAGAASAQPAPGPHWSSDQIRAARPLAPEPAVVFEVERTLKSPGAADKVTRETVTLAPSFTLVHGQGDDTLFDRTLCRSLQWSAARPVLANHSCYADAAFKVLELDNRLRLGAITGQDPYWDEAELAIQAQPSDRLARSQAGAAVEYRLLGEVAARVSSRGTPLSAEETKRLIGYLAGAERLHPQVLRGLAAASALPERIEFAEQFGGRKGFHETLAITGARRSAVAYPVPAGLVAELRAEGFPEDPAGQPGLAAALAAIDGTSTIPRPSARELIQSMKQAAAEHRNLGAMLLFAELSQQYAGWILDPANADAQKEVRAILPAVMQDPEAARWMQVNNLAGGGQGDRQAAARYLAAAMLEGEPFGSFRYVTFANLVRASGDVAKWDPAIFKGMPKVLVDAYWIHIAAYPWASNAYKDAGDTYLQAFDMWKAWDAFDLGRAVDPDWKRAAMGDVARFEDQLRRDHAELF